MSHCSPPAACQTWPVSCLPCSLTSPPSRPHTLCPTTTMPGEVDLQTHAHTHTHTIQCSRKRWNKPGYDSDALLFPAPDSFPSPPRPPCMLLWQPLDFRWLAKASPTPSNSQSWGPAAPWENAAQRLGLFVGQPGWEWVLCLAAHLCSRRSFIPSQLTVNFSLLLSDLQFGGTPAKKWVSPDIRDGHEDVTQLSVPICLRLISLPVVCFMPDRSSSGVSWWRRSRREEAAGSQRRCAPAPTGLTPPIPWHLRPCLSPRW